MKKKQNWNNRSNRGNIGIAGANQQPLSQTIQVNDLPQILCDCGEQVFAQAIVLRFASRLVSATGQPTVVQVPYGWVCTSCGMANNFERTPETADLLPPLKQTTPTPTPTSTDLGDE